MIRACVFAAGIGCAVAAPAGAVSIGFEGLARDGGYTYYRDSGFSTDGFDFNLSYGFAIDSAFRYTRYYASNNGTDWLMHNHYGDLNVSATDGSSFSLTSVDAGQYSRRNNTRDVIVTGYRTDGTSLSQAIIAKADFQTVSFAGWTNLSKVTFSGNGYGTYDNFQLSLGSITAIPVPVPALLLISGLGAIAAVGRRRSRKVKADVGVVS